MPTDLLAASDIKKEKLQLSCSHQRQLGPLIETSSF